MNRIRCPKCEKERGVVDLALNLRCYACGATWHMCYDAAPIRGSVPRAVFGSEHSGIMCDPVARGAHRRCNGC
jgi:hypothetical protein